MKGGGLLAGICALDVALMVIAAVLYLGQDRTAPVISYGPDSLTYEEGMEEGLLLAGVTAQDERDGDVTESLMVEKISETSNGNVIITYVAKDHADNVGKASRTVRAVQGGQDLSGETKADTPGENDEGSAETGTESGTGNGTGPTEGQDIGTPGGEGPDGDEENREDNQEANQQPLAGDNGNAQGQPVGNVQPPEQGEARPEGQPQGEEQQPGDGQAQDGQGQGIPEGNSIEGNAGAGNEGGQAANQPPEGNQPPVLDLRTSSLSVQAGTQSVDWNQCIGGLSDDRDSQAQLFSNLVMEGFVDLNTPGEYPVMLYTRDSEGLESARQVVTVRVEE